MNGWNVIRDVFCFCALTGLAFTDADNLQKRHITTDDSGTTWIHKPREKTSVISRVPLLPYPLKILQKYEHNPELQLKGKLLPIPSNQKMNSYLKEIGTICNIHKNLTSALRSPHFRHIGYRIWHANRHHCQNPRTYKYEYDSALCKNFRSQY